MLQQHFKWYNEDNTYYDTCKDNITNEDNMIDFFLKFYKYKFNRCYYLIVYLISYLDMKF